ncbi:MAG: GNAT family N-acetyltransferase [Bacteroidia bacterium]
MKWKLILQTERLRLREAVPSDARFFYQLLRQPEWIRFVGDRGIHRVEDAQRYVTERLMPQYELRGYGLWVVSLRGRQGGIGICGLVRRDGLDAPDIGFALLNAHVGKGYIVEAAEAVMRYSFETLHLPKVFAITNADNERSVSVLQRIGMQEIEGVVLPGETMELRRFVLEGNGG